MKPIKICEYKGHEIKYEEGLFKAYKGKEKTAEEMSEQSCKDLIDGEIEDKENEEKKAKGEKEKKKQEKNLSKCKIIVNSEKFKQFISAINDVISEVKLKVTKDKIEVTGMDPANVLMFHKELELEKTTVPFIFPINLIWLGQFLRRIKCSKKKNIEITFGFEEETKKCFIKSEEARFSLPLINLEEDEVKSKIPDLEFECVLKMENGDFNRAISLCNCASEKVRFISSGKELHFFSQEGLMRMETKSFPSKGKANASYSQEYLKKLKLGNKLKIEFKNDYPVKISDEKCDWYILAPRVEND